MSILLFTMLKVQLFQKQEPKTLNAPLNLKIQKFKSYLQNSVFSCFPNVSNI